MWKKIEGKGRRKKKTFFSPSCLFNIMRPSESGNVLLSVSSFFLLLLSLFFFPSLLQEKFSHSSSSLPFSKRSSLTLLLLFPSPREVLSLFFFSSLLQEKFSCSVSCRSDTTSHDTTSFPLFVSEWFYFFIIPFTTQDSKRWNERTENEIEWGRERGEKRRKRKKDWVPALHHRSKNFFFGIYRREEFEEERNSSKKKSERRKNEEWGTGSVRKEGAKKKKKEKKKKKKYQTERERERERGERAQDSEWVNGKETKGWLEEDSVNVISEWKFKSLLFSSDSNCNVIRAFHQVWRKIVFWFIQYQWIEYLWRLRLREKIDG